MATTSTPVRFPSMGSSSFRDRSSIEMPRATAGFDAGDDVQAPRPVFIMALTRAVWRVQSPRLRAGAGEGRATNGERSTDAAESGGSAGRRLGAPAAAGLFARLQPAGLAGLHHLHHPEIRPAAADR